MELFSRKVSKIVLLKIILAFVIVFISPIFLYAQIQNARFEHLTINDGLSQGSVKCILRDKIGFMWFGTQDGLNRYDGYSFKVNKNEINDSTTISSNNITCIGENNNGDLWIGTSNGLNKFCRKKNNFKQFYIDKLLKENNYSNWIHSILIPDAKDYIWFSTREALFKLNIKTNKIDKYFPPYAKLGPDDYVISIFAFEENLLFLGMLNGDVFSFDTRTNVFTKIFFKKKLYSSSIRAVSSFAKDNNNNLWIGTHDGLFKYDIKTKESEEYYHNPNNSNSLAGNLITSIVYHDNFLWIAASGFGLDRFDIKNKTFTNFKNDQSNPYSLNLDVLLSLYLDESGILWIGTNGNGVDKLNPYLNNFTFFTQTEEGLSIKSIRTFYEDNKGNLWVGGYNGINKLDRDRRSYSYIKHSPYKEFTLSNAAVYVIAEDKDDPYKYLWIGTEGSGLNKLDMITNLIYRDPLGDFWNKDQIGKGIYSLLDDGEGNLWIGNNKGLDIINKKTRKWRHFEYEPSNPESISPQAVSVIYKDREDRFWIGTDQGGICLVDRSNFKFKRYSFNQDNSKSISNNFIKCIYQDSKKRLWIGTNGGGLNLFEKTTESFIKFTSKDGLPNDVVYGIVEDYDRNLWLSTNNGISKFDPEKKSFTNYDVRDGLQSNEFNTNAYYKDKKGNIYFGGINGFNVITPSSFHINSNPPNIVFTNFELFNKTVDIDKEVNGRVLLENSIEETRSIELNYDENVFSIEFTALDFISPLKSKYSYYMDGFDKRWTEPSENRKVTYTNLYPGRYVFKVKGTNNDGVWSIRPIELEIIIVPPFWQTWWFITIFVLVFFAILVIFYFIRINEIKKQKDVLEKEVKARTSDLAQLNQELLKSKNELIELNQSKDKFFSIFAHDLRGPFSGVLGLSEILVEDIDELNKEEIKDLSFDINQILHEQFILLENLLGLSRLQLNKFQFEPERINLSEIATRVYRFLLNNAKSKKITMEIYVPENIYVSGNSTMLISIIQNLVSNAIKFTNEEGNVKISASAKENTAEVILEDTGVGMNEETLNKLFKTNVLISTDGTAKEKGSGLGLLLVNEFVTRMGGTVQVESQLSKGSKFIVTLPLDMSEQAITN